MKQLFFINLLATCTLVVCTSVLSQAQSSHVLPSGQEILIYSDYTWEKIAKSSENSPFQKSKNHKKSKADLIERGEKVAELYSQLEIATYINTLQAPDDTLSMQKLADYTQKLNLLKQIDVDDPTFEQLLIDSEKELNIIVERESDNPYKPAPKVNTSLPKRECNVSDYRSGIVENLVGRATKKSQLLTYTPSKLTSYYKEKPYLTLMAQCIWSAKSGYIEIEVAFNSKDIQKSYGKIGADGFVRFEMVNGKIVIIKPMAEAIANIEPYTGRTIYTLMIKVEDPASWTLLENKIINEIGIMWTSGFESYPVYDVDYFRNNIQCLNEK